LYSVSLEGPNHDAGIRIDNQAPGGGPILENGTRTTSCTGMPPPRT